MMDNIPTESVKAEEEQHDNVTWQVHVGRVRVAQIWTILLGGGMLIEGMVRRMRV